MSGERAGYNKDVRAKCSCLMFRADAERCQSSFLALDWVKTKVLVVRDVSN